MTTYWILGAGKFGRRAVGKLHTAQTDPNILVIDHDRSALLPFKDGSIQTRTADVIEYLHRQLTPNIQPDWIVPAVPLHVAFEWIKSILKPNIGIRKLPVPRKLINRLPCMSPHETGMITISLADFVCPEDCREPAKYCTVTGKPRLCDLFEKLAKIRIENFVSIVVRSRQLAPGLGGFRPKDLFDALDRVQTADAAILLSTACRCHGVLDAFRLGH